MASIDSNEYLTQSIVGLGNPLLDISVDVTSEFLEKYGLKLDNAILAEEKHLPMFEEITSETFKPKYVAGGSCQNSMRGAQWMLNQYNKNATSFFGAVGKDKHGQTLRACAEQDGLHVHYMEHDIPTGTCGVLIKDNERSLIANLSAANSFHHDHLEESHSKDIIAKGKFFYTTGFHLTVSPTSMMKLAEHAVAENKVFLLNLSAPFIMMFFKDPLMNIIPYADYIFANESEAQEFGKAQEWGQDIETIALKLSQLPKQSGARCRTVVFTQGSERTIVAQNGEITTFDVPKLDKSELVDTNGAGDAFVAGFLSRLALGKAIPDCVQAGHWCAQVVIRRSGCTFPEVCDYKD